MHASSCMSAIGPKRTSGVAPHMSAFGGKADIECYGGVIHPTLTLTICCTLKSDLKSARRTIHRRYIGNGALYRVMFRLHESYLSIAAL